VARMSIERHTLGAAAGRSGRPAGLTAEPRVRASSPALVPGRPNLPDCRPNRPPHRLTSKRSSSEIQAHFVLLPKWIGVMDRAL
jgi:hypothetical protein